MIKRKKNIFKHAITQQGIPLIQSSKSFIPEWFKKTDRLAPKSDKNVLPLNLTFKACSSFSDSFISGYMMPLAQDIAIKQTEFGPSITWGNNSINILSVRDKSANYLLPVPEGFSETHFAWTTNHLIKIPKGYSALLTHPLNRYDLPFITLSGIVDGDFSLSSGDIPVFFNKTFEGIIKAGTPILQIILFKSENWNSEFDNSIVDESYLNSIKSKNHAFGWYKENIWKKKTYE
jgi:hypothetical protein